MRYTIHSERLNETFNFWAPDEGGYVRREIGTQQIGQLGHQITRPSQGCESTITTSGDHKRFRAVCRTYVRRVERVRLGE